VAEHPIRAKAIANNREERIRVVIYPKSYPFT